MKKQTKLLLSAGVAAAVLFWLSTAVCGIVHGNYDHLHDTISELGALGTRSQVVFSVLLQIVSFLGICFFIGAIRACRESGISIIPVLPVILLALSIGGISFFPQGTNLHPIVGQVSLPVLFGPLLAIFLWRGKDLLGLRLLSLVSLGSMCAALLLILTNWASPGFRGNYEGFIQRLFHFGWSFWFAAVGAFFIRFGSMGVKEHRTAHGNH
jgi:hypothetical membrane protein